MRTLTLFALALFGTAALTDDASAIGKRKRGGSSSGSSSGCCDGGYGTSGGGYNTSGGGYGAGYGAAAPCCGGSAAAMPGGYPGHTGYGTHGQGTTVQATDGQFYTLGADGSYYAAPQGTYRGYSPYQGVTPAGYPGGRGYVSPAGGFPPLNMPLPRR